MIGPLGTLLQAVLTDAYEVQSELPRGGMSQVFVAEDRALGRLIVIKVLDPELAATVSIDRFKREVALTARLQHPHIVPIFTAGEVDGLPFYTMPFVAGDSLRSRIDRDGALPIADVLSVLRDVALALECAHGQNIIHRDIKPDNVLLAGRSAIVMDFGIAKAVTNSAKHNTELTGLGTTLGTPAYMAPEQAAADPTIDHRADLYSLGVMAYEMLAGETPFGKRSAVALIAAHVTEEPTAITTLRSGIPSGLVRVVARCLAKDPDARPQSAAEVLELLSGAGFAADGSDAVAIAAPEERKHSLGVLAFRNLSSGSENDYLSEGITEEILNALARIPELRVAARTSSFAFKGMDVDIKEIARKLRVGHLLEGSVRQSGTRLRVTAQLSKAADGFQMWSERYDRELHDVFELQDEIAARISEALKIALVDATGGPAAPPARRVSANMKAYELYLKARYYLSQRVDGMHKAMDLYRQALDLDPDFALAHAGVAEGYFLLTLYNAVAAHDGAPKAREAARRALELEPNLPEALIVLSNVTLWYDWDRDATIKLIDRALQLKPSDPLAHSCLAYYLATTGRLNEAVVRATYAAELDPLGSFAQSNRAIVNYLARHFAETVAACDTILELAPNYSEAYRWRALSQFHLAQWQEAFASIEAAVRLSQRHHWPLANQAAMLARAKKPEPARAILAELKERSRTEPIPELAFATIYFGLGELDSFFAHLDAAIDAREVWVILMDVEPGFAALREHPRFRTAMDRIVPHHGFTMSPLPQTRSLPAP